MELRENIGKNNTEMKHMYLSSVWACRVGVVPKTSESLKIEGFFELFYPLWYCFDIKNLHRPFRWFV